MVRVLLIIAAVLAPLSVPGLGRAQDTFTMPEAPSDPALEAEARDHLLALADEMINDIVAAPLPLAEKQARFRDVFVTNVDIPAVGRFVLGAYWRRASREERDRFLTLFEDLMVLSWSARFEEYEGQEIQATGTKLDSRARSRPGVYVETAVRAPGADDQAGIPVVWRLRKNADDQWQIIDIVVARISMLLTYKNEYGTVLVQHDGDVSKLNNVLEGRVKALRLGKKVDDDTMAAVNSAASDTANP